MTMEDYDIEYLAKRLDRLENENRRYKRVATLLLVAVGSVFLMAQVQPKRVVEAEAFVLKDETGKTRAWLGMAKDGAGFTIQPDGKVEQHEATESGPILQFLDKDGKMRVLLGVKRDWAGETAYVSLLDKHGSRGSGLTVAPDGSPSLRFGQ